MRTRASSVDGVARNTKFYRVQHWPAILSPVAGSSIDYNLLPVLDALLAEQSVTRAAARLGLSTPAMSHALARLRRQLDDPILVRAGRSMVPSPRAEELREEVAHALDGARRVLSPHRAFDPATSDRSFTVIGSDYVIMVLGSALDAQLRSRAPGIGLRFVPNTSLDPQRVREGDADIAIGVYDRLPPEVRIQKLFDEALVCVVRQDHPKVKRRLDLQTYVRSDHVQIAPRGRPGGVVDRVLAEQGQQRRVVRAVPFFFAGLVLVAQSDAILTIPRRLACAHADRFGLRMLEVPLELEPYAMTQMWHPRHDGDDAHRWFRSQIVEACKSTRPPRSRTRRPAR